MNNLDRAIALDLRINDSIKVRAMTHFAQACDACLMSELMALTPQERIQHADWFSTGPVDGTVQS